jgi:hypothetical protein
VGVVGGEVGKLVRGADFSLRIVSASGATTVLPVASTATKVITNVRLLAWTDSGILIRVHAFESDPDRLNRTAVSIRLVDPVGGGSRIVSRPSETGAYPVAVAAQLLDQKAVAGARPVFPSSDRSHLGFLWGVAWSRAGHGPLLLLPAGLLGLVMLWFRRRRRRAGDPVEP